MEITEILAFAQQSKASDIHLTSNNPPILRVNGEMRPVKVEPLTPDETKAMIYSIMTEEQRAEYEQEHELDFAIAFGASARFRVNAFTTNRGAAAVFRTIPTVVPTLEQLNAPPMFRRFCELEKGLVLVTGPTGSGKSTTLAAMIDHINRNQAKHILTIEDPVEFVHANIKCLINHRELGNHTKSFARALKSALREDPDVILVGEMRDHETIGLALTAAETGHLVMGTLHTSSAAKTIDRIIDVFPAGDKEMVRAMVAGSLQAVISQVLMKRIDGKGGRIAAHDILVGTPAVRNLIRENKVPQIVSMMQMGQRFGMQTLEDSVKTMVAQGIVAKEELERFAQPSAPPVAEAGTAAAAPAPAAAPAQARPAQPMPQAAAPRPAPQPASQPVSTPQAAPPAPPPPQPAAPPAAAQPAAAPKKTGVSSLFR
ncbi:MAG: type IV pilus twitching motility protein PilT [Rhodospirillales bacterium]|nr:type IV pilus twitching motility protein PilT [Rhodospirillales bacterium]